MAPLNAAAVVRSNVVYSSMLLSDQEGNKSEVQYVRFEMDNVFNFSNPSAPLFHYCPAKKPFALDLPNFLWASRMQARKFHPMFGSCTAINLTLIYLSVTATIYAVDV